MGRLSHTRKLGLWMNGAFVGSWSQAPNSPDTLQYDLAWIQSEAGRPLSLSLPFTPGNRPHRGDAVRAYFENLLPDSKTIRDRIARRYQAGSAEAFALLAQIGRDCVGALQLYPDGMAPAGPDTVQASPLSESDVAQVLRGTVAPTIATELPDDDFRISIAGAQEKTALLRVDGQWCRPHGSTPTTHIFKLPMGLVGNQRYDLSHSVENEWLCALILRTYGLPVANCEALQFEDMKALVVERFDRRWWGEEGQRQLIRLPQEDLCQATGTPPHLKYETDGGPGIDTLLRLLNGSTQREVDRRTFFQAQVLFWMLSATDGHAKNFSLFLRAGGRYELTPLYDVLSAYPFLGEGPGKLSPHKARLAMAVRTKNAHWKIREILRRHWVDLGEAQGVLSADGRPASQLIDDLVARTPQVVATVRGQLPRGFPPQVADSILEGLMEAAQKLAG
ncbi:type II toxin-antitoxin system HipA family toxin [Hylemonella gracilis]|nr:type II toxin-antitoxin system HipA family toxin [Hylemonella gracilis]